MNKIDLARESKTLSNNSGTRLQVTKTKKGYNAYRVYGNEYFKDDENETTIGFITYPMKIWQVKEWLEEQENFKRLAE